MKKVLLSLLITAMSLVAFAQNIGIGTTTPSKMLDVNGELRVRTIPTGNVASDFILTSDAAGNVRSVPVTAISTSNDSDWDYSIGSGQTGSIYHTGKVGVGATSTGSLSLLSAFTVRESNTATNGTDGVFIDVFNTATNTANTLAGIRFGNWQYNTTNDHVPGAIFWNSNGLSGGSGDMMFATGAAPPNTVGVNNTRMTITHNGDIGIGTTAPTKRLDVDGQARIRVLQLGNTATDYLLTADANGNLRRVPAASTLNDLDWEYSSGAGATGTIYHSGKAGVGTDAQTQLGTFTIRQAHNASTGGTIGTFLDIINSQTNTINTLAGIRFGNYNATPTNDFLPGGIFWKSTGQSFGRGDMIFATGATNNPANPFANARMTINNAGNVGIGTLSPTSPLQVNGDIQVSRDDKIKFGNNTVGDGEFIQNSFSAPTGAGYGLSFFVNSIEKARITSNGIGVGTDAPFAPIHVTKPLANGTLDSRLGFGTRGSYVLIDNPSSFNYGYYASVTGANSNGNYGIYTSVQDANQTGAYGVRTYANNASNFCYGVWASNSGTTGSQWAGYFAGRTFASGGAWTSSAKKLKSNIRPIEGALDKVMALEGKNYSYKREEYSQLNLPVGNQYGFVADEVEKVIPEAVIDVYHAQEVGEDGKEINGTDVNFKGMQYQTIIPVLVEAIKEQQAQIETLKLENDNLKNQWEKVELLLNQSIDE